MVSYEHDRITRAINKLDEPPDNGNEYSSWIRAKGHLQLLRNNASDPEVIIYASSRKTYVHTEITKKSEVTPPNTDDLINWSSTPYIDRAGYIWSAATRNVRVEYTESNPPLGKLKHRQNLIFGRRMEGLDDPYYYELLQEFAHTTGIHWREEQRAYCQVDDNGDIEPVVSITKPDAKGGIRLITCKREPLEQYLAATRNVLIRFFDFTMVNSGDFILWDAGIREKKIEMPSLFYEQCVHPDGHAFTRGAQVLPVTTPKLVLFKSITDPRSGRQYASFITRDWRNGKIEEVSTDPESTTSYFQAKGNSLPFEVSPAFFRPEVLSKYKADREKYTIHEVGRYITCRSAWELQSYDINAAGQVHAYICDLRNLPYQEQLHWKSHNENPKGTISQRAFENDIIGTVSSHTTALQRVLFKLRRWDEQGRDWWKVRDEALLLRVNPPVSNSKDEWSQAFLDLSKIVIEGFQTRPIRALLRQENISFNKEEKTLSLLEKLLASQCPADSHPTRLEGLRGAYEIRSIVHSHSGGKEADEIARNVIVEHGTYREHFERICTQIARELEDIEEILTSVQGGRADQPRPAEDSRISGN